MSQIIAAQSYILIVVSDGKFIRWISKNFMIQAFYMMVITEKTIKRSKPITLITESMIVF